MSLGKYWGRAACCMGIGVGVGCARSTPPPDVATAAPKSSEPNASPIPSTSGAERPPSTSESRGAETETAASPESGPTPTAETAPASPPQPHVEVVNIGMHIGGGPNDANTKAPFIEAIEPHFAAFGRCYESAHAEKSTTVGVDLLVPKAGGHAEVGEIRTGLKDAAFARCVELAFAAVEFDAPKLGATRFSYSLRLSPERD